MHSSQAGSILVIDDEIEILALVSYHLRAAGYEPVTASTGREGLRHARTGPVALIILDIMLPDMSGFDVLSELREVEPVVSAPCMMLSALRDDVDRIRGLTLGGDDYLTKPFNPDELVLRVRAILRRSVGPSLSNEMQSIGPLAIDRRGRRALVGGVDAGLTSTEYRLLLQMVANPGLAQTRQELLPLVWNAQADMQTRTVDVHVLRLRTKLGAAGEMIETVRGFGYRLSTEKIPP